MCLSPTPPPTPLPATAAVFSSSLPRPHLFADPSACLPYRVAKAAHSRSHLSVKVYLGFHLSNYLTVCSSTCQSRAAARAPDWPLASPRPRRRPLNQRATWRRCWKLQLFKIKLNCSMMMMVVMIYTLFRPSGKFSVSHSSPDTHSK